MMRSPLSRLFSRLNNQQLPVRNDVYVYAYIYISKLVHLDISKTAHLDQRFQKSQVIFDVSVHVFKFENLD